MSHTPEPWKADGVFIDTADGTKLVSDPLLAEDARRIVACVNLLAGVPTEELESALSFHGQATQDENPALTHVAINHLIRNGYHVS